MIPKPDGSERELGIPTVTDRLIQQALLQVLQPILDPTFSEHSYGFRPGRRAQDVVFVQAAHQATDAPLGRAQHGEGGANAAAVPAGMEGLLWPVANAKGLAKAGRVAATPATGHSAQALEARPYDIPRTASARRAAGRGTTRGGQLQMLVAQ